MVFKTMVALCQEVEPVFWERGGPRHCNAVLMTGIHGQCQVQVEIWMMVGKVGEVGLGWIPQPPNTTPGGLIQCTREVWALRGPDPLCCKKGIYWLLFRSVSFDILQGNSLGFKAPKGLDSKF